MTYTSDLIAAARGQAADLDAKGLSDAAATLRALAEWTEFTDRTTAEAMASFEDILGDDCDWEYDFETRRSFLKHTGAGRDGGMTEEQAREMVGDNPDYIVIRRIKAGAWEELR